MTQEQPCEEANRIADEIFATIESLEGMEDKDKKYIIHILDVCKMYIKSGLKEDFLRIEMFKN